MSKRLFHVKELVRGGIHQAEALAEQVLWVDGNNVIASERALRPILGHSAFLPSLSAEPITGLFEVSLGGFNNLFIASETKLIRFIEDANLTFYDVSSTPVAISRDSIWSLEEFGGRVFGCSGEAGDAIRYFPDDGTLAYDATKTMGPNAAGEFAQLVGTSIFKTLNVHLLAFAPDLDKKSFLWCDAGDGMTWIPTTTNAAGGIYIRDLEGDIAAVHNLASGLGVYGRNQLFYVQYVGYPNYFTVRPILSGIGAWSKGSVVQIGHLNYGLGPKGFWLTDGTSMKYLSKPVIQDVIFSDMNEKAMERTFLWHDALEESILISWPGAGSDEVSRSVLYKYNDKTWWPVQFQRTAATEQNVFNRPVTGDAKGNIFQQVPAHGGSIAGVFVPSEVGSGLGASLPLTLSSQFTIVTRYDANGYGNAQYGDYYAFG